MIHERYHPTIRAYSHLSLALVRMRKMKGKKKIYTQVALPTFLSSQLRPEHSLIYGHD